MEIRSSRDWGIFFGFKSKNNFFLENSSYRLLVVSRESYFPIR
ncbi:hypothetical protein LEP1GSC161_0498 [Leptospira santarosai str. CBC1416]|uniref:Uncharacterized protein n=3 Tax=Leptospira santarosai TaxID=28183 RepID=M6UWB8_9LEPT|nr:hypothetical protein LEP1GSC068_1111 [Leptospira sp. Fiocruz LV3954]EKS09180.1 hypothetical protein LEP1GSC071_1828 [Leptospira santarosai str. JET]EMF90541.1 hypothetical protein LEP1GSC005_2861 [Leptospira santarosai str. ST188]EMI66011.1 hypothetical protein LEP1GSC076_3334 [Leptospira sp. Fiocruz LV4135]EMJ50536.1 hypothetical protein LEP1GSC169_2481 [Leptospira santarosai str. HAI1349]EMM78464.1 hypothetical protein LEP1GSC040_0353 [Leptospira santarosai str. 2000030832]EMM88149.1 hyp